MDVYKIILLIYVFLTKLALVLIRLLPLYMLYMGKDTEGVSMAEPTIAPLLFEENLEDYCVCKGQNPNHFMIECDDGTGGW